MCRRVIAWVADDTDGSHNLRPVTCDEYVLALETMLYNAGRSLGEERKTGVADSERVRLVRKSLGIDSMPHDNKFKTGEDDDV